MSFEIYREIILDYYRNPRNFGTIPDAEVQARDSNPLCGDDIALYVKLDGDGRAADVKFDGRGCAISQASASMLTEMVKGKPLDQLRQLGKEQILKALGNPDLGPVRIKCALLSLKVLKTGLYAYLGSQMPSEDLT